MKVLVTGCAGFIGMHVTERLLTRGDEVIGVDNLNDYYAVELKRARLSRLVAHRRFRFTELDIADRNRMATFFAEERPSATVHLAAQAGVRYSLRHPAPYIDSNIVGFANILEGCRSVDLRHLVFASSSSVYGGNMSRVFSEEDNVDHPISLYAATKKANELMAHSYSHLFSIPITGLRFFTVYGPWGRPDMSYFAFTKAILSGEPIDLFNFGNMDRDFTYVDDVAEGVLRVLDKPATPDERFDGYHPTPASSSAPFRLFNIGNNRPVSLVEYVKILERSLGREAKRRLLPLQAGDVVKTSANIDLLERWVEFRPTTPLEVGINRFTNWYREYHRL